MTTAAKPTSVPPHANDIYKEAYNVVWEECRFSKGHLDGDAREQSCNKVALAAIRHGYKKCRGNWISNI